MEIEFTVSDTQTGTRLDAFLKSHLDELSRSRIQTLIANGEATVNSVVVKQSTRLKPGDIVTINVIEDRVPVVSAQPIPLHILYQDDDIIVVDKPAGMITHPAGPVLTDTLVNALLHLGPLAPTGSPLRPGIVHRLDKGTTGVIVAARNDFAYHSLVKQFSTRSVGKTYVAVAMGNVPLDDGEIVAPIGRSPSNPTRFAVSPINAKQARTTYRIIERLPNTTLLHIRIYTGRTHQIRVHFQYLGYPLVGDETYGGNTEVFPRPALHAHTLSLNHPRTNERLLFISPLPPDILGLLNTIRS